MVIKKQMNVRQTEQLVKSMKKPGATKTKTFDGAAADLDYLAESIRSHLKTKVKLQGSGSRGKIEISYFSSAELERIMTMIGVEIK